MQEKVTLARRAYFSAGRVLRRDDWSEEQNRAVFGKRSRPHGHDYTLAIFIVARRARKTA